MRPLYLMTLIYFLAIAGSIHAAVAAAVSAPAAEPPALPAPPRDSSASGDSALPVLRKMLESGDAASRVEGLEALGGAPGTDTLEIGFNALFDHDPSMRQRAAESLKSMPGPELARRLLDRLKVGDMFEVQVVEEALPRLQPTVEKPLIEVLEKDPDQTQRVLAAYALGYMKAPEAVEGLSREVWQDDRILSMTCVQALGRMRIPQTLPYLQTILGHPAEEIRWEAVHGIGNLKTPEALQVLLSVIVNGREENLMIPKQALRYMGSSDRAEAIPLVIRSMEYSQALRDVGGEALLELTGQHYGSNPMGWRRWYQEELAAGRKPEQLLASYAAREALRQHQEQQMKGEIVYETLPGGE